MDGFGTDGQYRWGSSELEVLMQAGRDSEDIMKALSTGDGVVLPGATGGSALRTQFLAKKLETVSFEQNDAVLMKRIPKKKAGSTAIEWTNYQSYGGVGDGFTTELGSDGNGNVTGADDNFSRQIQNVRYLATQRTVTIASTMVNNIENPLTVAETGATLNLIMKAELGLYNADSQLSNPQFNGIKAQCMQWLDTNPADSGILYDAGGAPIDQAMIEDIAITNRLLYGRGSLLLSSVPTFGDIQKALFPQARFSLGDAGGGLGLDRRTAKVPYGNIELLDSPMLRANQPLAADGPGVIGTPRTSSTADAGALAFASNPFVSPVGASAGTGNFWRNYTRNTDGAACPKPALPTGGNNSNHLAAGDYYYLVAPVYQGLEGVGWVNGASAAGTMTGATAVSPTDGQVVNIAIDCTTPCITGLGTTYPLNQTKWRVYRAPSTATSFAQFKLLGETGSPTAGNATLWDNGFNIPGADQAFLITEQKNGVDGWGFWQLLPLMKRELPHTAMFELFALLLFATPILRVPKHHMIIRNIGKWVAS